MKNNISIPKNERTIAAVDLGSNSFHMIVASIEDNGTLKIVDKIKEMVRLGSGLDANNILDESTQLKALDCLSRFSQRLQNIPAEDIRIAATNTLRIAKNSHQFIKKAKKILNHRIDIISGAEEARLVYHGAIYSLAELGNKRLVIDIGGGSTEFIIGKNNKPKQLESLEMGCVSITKKFFPNGVINKTRLKKADIFSRQRIQNIRQSYIQSGWQQCVGTSGSIRSISKVLLATGITDGTITDTGLKQLLEEILKLEHIDNIKLDGLSKDREAVFIGGLVVLNAAFKALKIKQMVASDGALREGLMLDIIGRIKHKDIRESSIKKMVSRYEARQEHAQNIILSCRHLYNKLKLVWLLENQNHKRLLEWAASLHDIGLAISHSGYHKHGAYLVHYSDMPGFSLHEQQLLALFIRCHRHRISLDEFDNFSEKFRQKLFYIIIILRLAIILNRSQSDHQKPHYKTDAKEDALTISFPPGWLDDNPLTAADLENEISYLKIINFDLQIKAN